MIGHSFFFDHIGFPYLSPVFYYTMEKHVHSILAKDFQRKKRKTHKPITNKNTHKYRQVTLHTNEKGRQDPGCLALRTGVAG